MNGRQAHRMGTLVLSLAMVVIGLALLVQAVGGSASGEIGRALLGLLFLAAGCGRWYVQLKRDRAG